MSLMWLSRKVRQVWEGFFGFLDIYLLTVDWDTSIPSFSNSPCTLGAPQSWLAWDISRIRFLISGSILFLPAFLGRDFHRQNNLNPFLCQRMTVSGLTMSRASFQRDSNFEIKTNRIRSEFWKCGLFCLRWRTINCCLSKRISRPSCCRLLNDPRIAFANWMIDFSMLLK